MFPLQYFRRTIFLRKYLLWIFPTWRLVVGGGVAMSILVLANGDLLNDEAFEQFLPHSVRLLIECGQAFLHQVPHSLSKVLKTKWKLIEKQKQLADFFLCFFFQVSTTKLWNWSFHQGENTIPTFSDFKKNNKTSNNNKRTNKQITTKTKLNSGKQRHKRKC